MGIQNLQHFMENSIPGACVPVDLLKIARSIAIRRAARVKGPQFNRLCLVVDGECCLDRLYGGFYSDWVCGGQWNRMVQFLAVLIQTVQSNFIELGYFFDGSLEQQRMPDWIKEQLRVRRNINQVLKHLNTKGTPPPKIWWVPPVCLRTCLRMALRHLNIIVVSTMDDHHQEVIAYCRENYFDGLIAEDAEYAIFDPPRYFSSEQLKLTYKGSLETKEFILDEVAKGLDLHPARFCVFAALLGNYLLTDEDLADFHKLLCVDHQGTNGKIPFDIVVKGVAGYVRSLHSIDNVEHIGTQIFGSATDVRVNKLKECVQYYVNGTKDGFLRYWPSTMVGSSSHPGMGKSGQESFRFASETAESEKESFALYMEATAGRRGPILKSNDLSCKLKRMTLVSRRPKPPGDSSHGTMNGSCSDSSDEWHAGGKTNGMGTKLPPIPPEVIRTASERHQKGLMSPWIYQILTQGEMKIPVILEDDSHREVPNIAMLFRPVRQMVYGILFNLHHLEFLAKKGTDKSEVPQIHVREWVWSKVNPYKHPEAVDALPVGWAVPTVQRLWFGSAMDDKKRRLRAFLSCMRADTPLMLNTSYVPQHLLILACVLRYVMSSERSILGKQELDAFICQAFSPQLTDAHFLQDVQLPVVSSRGVQLAAMLMMGVETALFANDACGAPIPWLMCCPWLFFDGKLFHLKLIKANNSKNLMEVCDGQLEMVTKVERMREAVLEGLRIDFFSPRAPMLAPPPTTLEGPMLPMGRGNMLPMSRVLPANRSNVIPPTGRGTVLPPASRNNVYRGNLLPQAPPAMPRGRERAPISGRGPFPRRPLSARGGQLEIGGVVVGNWGPNYSLSRGRGLYMAPQVMTVGGLRPGYPNTARSLSFPVGRKGRPKVQKKKPVKKKEVNAYGRGNSGSKAFAPDEDGQFEDSLTHSDSGIHVD